ncbi:RIO1 family protein [Cardiosporidium cionae]|uniref:non-specific serine/threonine protein kinase n=1 Tax=Cardiosporidium cionae TaxID=476202 RepID=A0ABQ7J911_9APIC|nr:RIO1 family protein [Cardiosporidium cionae]|eukprot:KAF8820150.1 RIO1 family protein [Cardiosporidium cionae]
MVPAGLTQDTRATAGLVLDPQTLRLLFELQKRGVFSRLMGCVSTGKEANVFRAELFDNSLAGNKPDASNVSEIHHPLESWSTEEESNLLTENPAKLRYDGKNHELSIPLSKTVRIRKGKRKILSSTGTSILAALSGTPSRHTQDAVNTLARNDDSLLSSTGPMSQLAVKVFKTSILIFKDRSKYVEGDFRFRMGYQKSRNPRKMVRQWAEKEFRNLRRCYLFGVRCPIVFALRGHVLVMRYLPKVEGMAYETNGKDISYDGSISHEKSENVRTCTLFDSLEEDFNKNLLHHSLNEDVTSFCSTQRVETEGNAPLSDNDYSAPYNLGYRNLNVETGEKSLLSPAPKLKEICVFAIEWHRLYIEVICSMRQLYQQAHLIHGDLSEFNILYYQRHPYIIDVSQAVEPDHPNSMEFLKLDCQNITLFFQSAIRKATRTKDEVGKDSLQFYVHEEIVTLCGVNLTQCSLFSIRELFDFIINPTLPFISSSETLQHDKKFWPEFDREERSFYYQPKHAGRSATPYSSLSQSNGIIAAVEHRNTKRDSVLHHRQTVAYLCRCTAQYLFELAQEAAHASSDYQDHFVRIEEPAASDDSQNWPQESIYPFQGDAVSGTTTEELAENSLSETELEEAIFLNTWIPSHLQQLNDLSVIEKHVDRYNKGETLFYERLLQQNRSQSSKNIKNYQSDYFSDCKDSETTLEDETPDEDDTPSMVETSLKEIPPVDPLTEASVTENIDQAEIKFNGVIPEGVDKKEWKKMVKEMNKERRTNKTPKYTKKKNRKNAHNKK